MSPSISASAMLTGMEWSAVSLVRGRHSSGSATAPLWAER